MWNPFAGAAPDNEAIQPEQTIEELRKQQEAEEDLKYWLSGEAFNTNDKFITYFRKVSGIIAAQMFLTLSLGFLCYESGAIQWIL
jgi:hypothetical protein